MIFLTACVFVNDDVHMQLLTKRLFDVFASFAGIIIFLPIFVVVALLIKIEDGGPVFFWQQRLGKSGYPFSIWKFRTMIVNADAYVDAAGRPTRVRVTRVGSVLRKLSVDELPQLINILLGDMSVVGPRPALLSHYARYTEKQRSRLQMRPGITGLAQVNGRNTLKWSRRIQYDLSYIQDYSLALDFRIILKTFSKVFFREDVVMDRNPSDVDDLGPSQPDVSVPSMNDLNRD